jgi:hypothetical protein
VRVRRSTQAKSEKEGSEGGSLHADRLNKHTRLFDELDSERRDGGLARLMREPFVRRLRCRQLLSGKSVSIS